MHMWEQEKWAMVFIPREVCGSVRIGGGNLKSLRWNDQVKAAVKRKVVLEARDKDSRERSTNIKRERLKGAFIKVRRGSKNRLEGR